MSEKIPNSGAERQPMPEIRAEHYERAAAQIDAKAEKSIESTERAVERTKAAAMETAISVERGSSERREGQDRRVTSSRRPTTSKKERDASYARRLAHTRAHMSPAEKAFSSIIHQKTVEKVSDVVGSTIARPNATLAGAVTAFVAVLGVYLVAKVYGYPLSGFETIAAFIVGWVAGILFDFFKVMITGKK